MPVVIKLTPEGYAIRPFYQQFCRERRSLEKWRGAASGAMLSFNNHTKTMNEPININSASFDKAVLQSPLPVLVDFWAPWCGPCQMIGPVLKEIAHENADRFRVTKVNIDDDPELQQRFQVRGVPTLLFFQGGQLKDQVVGVLSKKAIVEKLEKLEKPAAA